VSEPYLPQFVICTDDEWNRSIRQFIAQAARLSSRAAFVGRSDATERSLPLHWETRSRLNEASVRGLHQGQQSSGLREQAGHMTASDFCAAREVISCQAGAIHT
jgi:hypothetical protein